MAYPLIVKNLIFKRVGVIMKKMLFVVFLLVIAFSSCNMLTNAPPNTPGSPNPVNNGTWVNLAVTLTWTCSDPNGDPLTYDVYFGTNPNPTNKIGTGLNTASKFVGGLAYYTDYYWKVVANDGRGGETSSQVWHFRTKPYVVIDENFESYALGTPSLPWANYVHSGSTYGRIYNLSGNKVLEFVDFDVSGYAWVQTPGGWPGLNKGMIQFDILTWDADGWAGFRPQDLVNTPLVGVGYINNELILFTYVGASFVKIMNVNTNTWYTVRIIFDYVAHEYNIFVNNVFKGNYSVPVSTTYLYGLQFLVFSDNICTYVDFDNIKLYSYVPGWTPSPEFSETESTFDKIPARIEQ